MYAQRVTHTTYEMFLRLVTVALSITLILGATTTRSSSTRAVSTTPSRVKPASTATPLSAQIRLRPMNLGEKYRGFVEVLYNGEWGIVCDDYWDLADARVACRQLGHADAISALTDLVTTPERTDYFLDDVLCNGTEASIAHCDHDPWKQHDCGAGEMAGVTCLIIEASTFDRDICENPFRNFYCASSGECKQRAQRCDGTTDCLYGEDEAGCETSTTGPKVPVSRDTCLKDGKFYCTEAKSCIWIDWRCDGGHDCVTNEDEIDCTTENVTRRIREGSPCGSTIDGSGNIQSPQYPKKYDYDLYCNWTLVANPYYGTIVLKVYAFSTEFGSDFVSIYNSSGLIVRLSGIDIPSTISLYGSEIAVEFTTDGRISSSGFSMSFSTEVSPDFVPIEVCELQQRFYCTQSGRCISMSSLCDGRNDCYPGGEDEDGCTTASSVSTTTAINLLNACLDQGNFYCEYSGECIAMWHRCDGYSNCTFSEDELRCDHSFPKTHHCGGALNGSGVISSPNYPRAYPNNTFCSWTLQSNPSTYVLVVTFQSFDTKANNDVVRVYYDDYLIGTYSGSLLPPRLVLGSRGKVTFVSQNNTSAKGFTFTYDSYDQSKADARELNQGKRIVLSGYVAALILGLTRFGQQ